MRNLKLIELRKKHGLTQDVLANALGITVQAYSMKENGVRKFSQDDISKVYKYFRIIEPKLNMQDIFL